MKIAVRGGHNYQATGASGYLNEVDEDRRVKDSVIGYLIEQGHEVLDCTPGNTDKNSDLSYGVNAANGWNADVFVSIHFNAFDDVEREMGTESVTYGDSPSVVYGDRISARLVSLGFKQRPNKVNKELYEVRMTTMPAVIVEVCFVDSYGDYLKYLDIGVDAIGKGIAEGILNTTIQNGIDYNKEICQVYHNGEYYTAITGANNALNWAKENLYGNVIIKCIADGVVVYDIVINLDYDKEICQVYNNGEYQTAITGAKNALNWAKENLKGSIVIKCIKDGKEVYNIETPKEYRYKIYSKYLPYATVDGKRRVYTSDIHKKCFTKDVLKTFNNDVAYFTFIDSSMRSQIVTQWLTAEQYKELRELMTSHELYSKYEKEEIK